jgi:hypothetical protein
LIDIKAVMNELGITQPKNATPPPMPMTEIPGEDSQLRIVAAYESEPIHAAWGCVCCRSQVSV